MTNNKMMNKKEFSEAMRKEMSRRFPECDITVKPVTEKENMQGYALCIRNGEPAAEFMVHLSEDYWDYCHGSDFYGIADEMAVCVRPLSGDMGVSSLFDDYGRAKDRLFIKFVNRETNDLFLFQKLRSFHGEFAAVYYMKVAESERGLHSIPLTREMLDRWGVPSKTLHEDAVRNMEKDAVLYRLKDVVTNKGYAENLLEKEETGNQEFLVLTNRQGMNGDSLLLSRKVLRCCSEILQGDFIILPSSIHEVLLAPVSIGFSKEQVKRLVIDANEDAVGKEAFLSNNPLLFHADQEIITLM